MTRERMFDLPLSKFNDLEYSEKGLNKLLGNLVAPQAANLVLITELINNIYVLVRAFPDLESSMRDEFMKVANQVFEQIAALQGSEGDGVFYKDLANYLMMTIRTQMEVTANPLAKEWLNDSIPSNHQPR